jgi:hypothetical protein
MVYAIKHIIYKKKMYDIGYMKNQKLHLQCIITKTYILYIIQNR